MSARILVVEDDPSLREGLALVLRKQGYAVDTAIRGQEALKQIREQPFDLMILDLMLPGLDGSYVLEQARREGHLLPVIILSARGSVEDKIRGLRNGADDYVTKPFDEDELRAKINVYLKLKSMEEVDRLKSDLLSLLNHETRTPLTFMLAPAEMLLSDASATQEQRELLQMIVDGAQRLQALLGRVAFLSALKCGHAGFTFAREDLCAILLAQARAAEEAAGNGVRIRTSLPAKPIEAYIDGAKIATVARSLLENAIRFSAPGSEVELTVTGKEDEIEWRVRDHGEGIAPAFLPRVFDEFAVQDVKHHSAGHGLSLATARLIVRRHGGAIHAQNEPDGGATFLVRLPQRLEAEAEVTCRSPL